MGNYVNMAKLLRSRLLPLITDSHGSIILRHQSSEAVGRWQIVGAACITRPPTLCPPLRPIEAKYLQSLHDIENEASLKSDHELRNEQDVIRAQILKAGNVELEIEETSTQTAVEFEDACEEELNSFEFATTTTADDSNGDNRSTERSLDRPLVLVVKQRLGSDSHWVLPQLPWQPGESLRQTCERVVKETCGDNLKVQFLGNAPCGFYKYKFPKQARKDGYIGAKVFFYKGFVNSGNVEKKSDTMEDFQWLTQDQLDSTFKRSYAESVNKFIISDN